MKKYGVVTEIYDPYKFVIKFTIEGEIENAIAYPVDTFDEPNVGDPVEIEELESIFGYSFTYKKLRLKNHTRLKLGKSTVELDENGINITTDKGNTVFIDSDGAITISSSSNIDVISKSSINIKAEGNIDLNCKGTVNVKAGTVQAKGTVQPSVEGGPFNALKVCPYTGQLHSGSVINCK